ncbi:MAG TPA: MFS transporter [Alteromonas sp.]|jgi:GPH family glycoside/pentoside/hexuronide:cation symporter|nr:MFS transporter [Alteromonadaceae bacterium]HAU93639.1 MFS transporter [Alteromonas sp.]HCA75045.1 MFS transporter [Alteromonas sp.]HCB16610.1 MFS transporter [Alteromonas sp.]HCL11913.1 MFS transporter [Alteromonas sp.]|tara:strand:- start:14535 stop:15878 length:1344 start_codon:yes stop_codon:yes gene_type:complete
MISVKEKVAYGLGDTASNFVFQTVILFLTFYYTDVVGLNPVTVGSIFLLVRLIDAVTDPLMGSLADKTRTRWGAYRPYLLWMALPFALISVIAFTTPDTDYNGKLIYAIASYVLLMLMYTAINIPYSALGGVITASPLERVSVQSYRFVFAMLGGLIVSLCTLPMVNWYGAGNDARGYQLTMLTMGLVGMVLFLLCFAGTRERVLPAEGQPSPVREQLKAVWHNDQCRILCVVSMVLLTGIVLRNALAIYYVKYVLQRPDAVTLFVSLAMVGGILGAAAAHPFTRRCDKVLLYKVLQLSCAGLCIVNYFLPATMWVGALVIHFLWGFVLQMTSPLLWSKMGDVTDYGELQTGTRLTAMTFSTIVFFIKLGIALGSALAGWALAYYGYEANNIDERVSHGITLSFCLIPATMSLVVVLLMRWYKLDSRRVDDIHNALKTARQTRRENV